MNDWSTALTTTPVQVVAPAAAQKRDLLILHAPCPSNASGGNGDLYYSFTLTGAAVQPGAPGTFLLQGGQTAQFGGQTNGSSFVPIGALWAVAARAPAAGSNALCAITAISNDYGA